MNREIQDILMKVRDGSLSVEEASLQLKLEPFHELGYAKVDIHRKLRQGVAEVIYGAGKKPEQICGIISSLQGAGQNHILITRLAESAADIVRASFPDLHYDALSHIGIIGTMPEPDGNGRIVVATGGTSDIPVAEEAALTAQILGNEVQRLYDVGVSGLHRLLRHAEDLMTANVIITIAGMEGALPSVVGGLVECPVIAVPTSVGYGANFGGLSALLSMLNSCASGIAVVNIDNGFGAGFLASRINHQKITG